MAAKKPNQEPVLNTFSTEILTANTITMRAEPMEEQDMFDRIFNRIAERSKVIADLRKELADAKVANDTVDTLLDNAMKERSEAQDLAEERKTQREAAYEAQREAEARAEKAEGVMDRFRALPEFADLFEDDETEE